MSLATFSHYWTLQSWPACLKIGQFLFRTGLDTMLMIRASPFKNWNGRFFGDTCENIRGFTGLFQSEVVQVLRFRVIVLNFLSKTWRLHSLFSFSLECKCVSVHDVVFIFILGECSVSLFSLFSYLLLHLPSSYAASFQRRIEQALQIPFDSVRTICSCAYATVFHCFATQKASALSYQFAFVLDLYVYDNRIICDIAKCHRALAVRIAVLTACHKLMRCACDFPMEITVFKTAQNLSLFWTSLIFETSMTTFLI